MVKWQLKSYLKQAGFTRFLDPSKADFTRFLDPSQADFTRFPDPSKTFAFQRPRRTSWLPHLERLGAFHFQVTKVLTSHRFLLHCRRFYFRAATERIAHRESWSISSMSSVSSSLLQSRSMDSNLPTRSGRNTRI